jgi:hypothetical protein
LKWLKPQKAKNKDAVNMYLVIKYAEQLKGLDPVDFSLAIGRNESYATEFRKGLKVAFVIRESGPLGLAQ